MKSVTGALGCSTASPGVDYVYGPRFVLASYTGRTSSDYAIYRSEAVLSLVEVIHVATSVVFTAAWQYLVSIGRFRWAVGQTSAPAMISAERASKIVSAPCCVARVLLHRSAGSSSWRRRVSRKGLSVPSEDILNNLSLLYCVPLIVRYQPFRHSQQILVRIVLVSVFGAYHGQGGSSEGGLDDGHMTMGISKRQKVPTTYGIQLAT